MIEKRIYLNSIQYEVIYDSSSSSSMILIEKY